MTRWRPRSPRTATARGAGWRHRRGAARPGAARCRGAAGRGRCCWTARRCGCRTCCWPTARPSPRPTACCRPLGGLPRPGGGRQRTRSAPGIVPETPLAARFREAQGALNQRLAGAGRLRGAGGGRAAAGAEGAAAVMPPVTRFWWIRHGPTHQKAFAGWRDVPADLSDARRAGTGWPRRCRATRRSSPRTWSAPAPPPTRIQGPRRRLPHDARPARIRTSAPGTGCDFQAAAARDPVLSRAYLGRRRAASPPAGGESWDMAAARVARAVDRLRAARPAAGRRGWWRIWA